MPDAALGAEADAAPDNEPAAVDIVSFVGHAWYISQQDPDQLG